MLEFIQYLFKIIRNDALKTSYVIKLVLRSNPFRNKISFTSYNWLIEHWTHLYTSTATYDFNTSKRMVKKDFHIFYHVSSDTVRSLKNTRNNPVFL